VGKFTALRQKSEKWAAPRQGNQHQEQHFGILYFGVLFEQQNLRMIDNQICHKHINELIKYFGNIFILLK
jgi:hypothetical protein